jgi:hypothetical protein
MRKSDRGYRMNEHREQLRQMQRDAIWKWRWLGLRNSTPGFKGALAILGVAAVYVAVRALNTL